MWVYIIIAALITGAGYWTLKPLLQNDGRKNDFTPKPEDILEKLNNKKEGVYTTIRELEFDLSMGKLSEEDFQILKRQYMREAAGYMKEMGEMESLQEKKRNFRTNILRKKLKKRINYKPIIISAVILVIIGYLIYSGLRDTMTFYLTVSEVLAKPAEHLTETLKVGGTVAPRSVQWDPKTLKLSFRLEDEMAKLTINYTGVVPDSFKPGTEVIVDGAYRGDGTFEATAIMPKCASKYE